MSDRINSLLKNNNRAALVLLTQKHQTRGLSKLNKRELATIIYEADFLAKGKVYTNNMEERPSPEVQAYNNIKAFFAKMYTKMYAKAKAFLTLLGS